MPLIRKHRLEMLLSLSIWNFTWVCSAAGEKMNGVVGSKYSEEKGCAKFFEPLILPKVIPFFCFVLHFGCLGFFYAWRSCHGLAALTVVTIK